VIDRTAKAQPLRQSTDIALFEIDYYNDPKPVKEPDKVERYLSDRVIMVRDPISWWKDHQQQFPQLSVMALEFLLIPGMSDEVKRVFSSAKLVLGLQRVAMGENYIGMLQCLKNWSCN